MRGRGAGSADGRSGRREAVGGVGVRPGKASVIAAAHDLGHSDEPHTPSLGSPFVASANLNSFSAKKKADHWVYPFLARELSVFRALCRKSIFCALGDLRQEVER